MRKSNIKTRDTKYIVHSSLSDKQLEQAIKELDVSMGSIETILFVEEELRQLDLCISKRKGHRFLLEEYAGSTHLD